MKAVRPGSTEGQAMGRTASGVVVPLLLATILAGCGTARTPELRMPMPSGSSVGVGLSDAPHDQPVAVGSMVLCLTGPGTATITGVDVHDATGDIRVEAFALRSNPFVRGLDGVGLMSATLAEIGDGFDPGAVQQVSDVCPTEAEMAEGSAAPLDEFAVQVSWSSGELSGGNALDLTYEIAGIERTAVLPVGIWLCRAVCPDDLGP